MEWSKIHCKIWTDDWIRSLSKDEDRLFIHLLTNIQCNYSRIYEYPFALLVFLSKMNREEVEAAMRKFEAAGKAAYYKDHIIIANAWRYQDYNANMKIACQKEIRKLPPQVAAHPLATSSIEYFMANCPDYQRPLWEGGETIPQPLEKHTPKPEKAPPKEITAKLDYKRLLDHWNSKGLNEKNERNEYWHYHKEITTGWKKVLESVFASQNHNQDIMHQAIDNYADDCLTPGTWRNQHPENWWTIYLFFKQSNGFLAFCDKKLNKPKPGTTSTYTRPGETAEKGEF